MLADACLERVGRVVEPVVDHHVGELVARLELLVRGGEPRGDLVRNLPEAQRASYAPERYQIREQVAGSSALLADDAADVAMVGNSYSQPLYGFSSLLSNQLNRPVSLFWKPNNFGPYNILLSYLTSEGFKQQKPKMIVWVQLEWDIPALPTGSGWGQNAMPAEKFPGDVRRAVGA